MNPARVVSVIFFCFSLGLAYYLYSGIETTVKQHTVITTTEHQIIEKLQIIREAENLFLDQYGHYTSNWDSLINFIETARIHEHQSVKEKIFLKATTILCANDGIFSGFAVKPGDKVQRSTISYKLKKEGSPNTEMFTFLYNGTVSKLARITPGDKVTKGQYLMTLQHNQFNELIDLKNIHLVPGSNKVFEIYTSEQDSTGARVPVICVSDPDPINPDRKISNTARNRQPLHFGSKGDASTAGNWE